MLVKEGPAHRCHMVVDFIISIPLFCISLPIITSKRHRDVVFMYWWRHYCSMCSLGATDMTMWKSRKLYVYMMITLRDNMQCLVNYANPVYGVATICHQIRWLRWGHPTIFHTAGSLLIWCKVFCVRDISCRLIWMEFINMFSVYMHNLGRTVVLTDELLWF